MAFSAQLGIPEIRLAAILAETAPVTPAIADKLAAVLGNEADFWNLLQRQHDLSAPVPLIRVTPLDEVFARLEAAFQGIPSPKSHNFISQELADKVLTPSRRNIIEVLTNRGGLSLAEIATATGQTIEGVRADVQALCLAGLLCQPDADHAAFS